ncbi:MULTISPECIES: hypothetical protein [Cohnella]|uniref:Glucose uptake protein n=1 Tax=Cohnella phaseoli TaxID=456490 RepID=A0A3D9IU33_9BACL|nr:hypothetical protein [Cohnella phaseoli]RED65268.1 hypothetical protein DFP98_12017 [Cohnella phaseoli]
MTETGAIFMILTAAFLWGSWLMGTKYTKDFPLPAFMLWLYTSSFVLVWVVVLISEVARPTHFIPIIAASPWLAVLVMICGGAMAIGMQIQMSVVGKVGLILSNSVSATSGVLLGTLVTVIIGGLPDHVSVRTVVIAAVILIFATFVCQYSGKLRDRDLNRAGKRQRPKQDTKAALMLIFSSVLVAAYPLGLSSGVRTDFGNHGFPALVCIGLLSLGSFIGTVLYSGYLLTKQKQLRSVLDKKYKKAIMISCLCGVCHYGGNLIHVLAAPMISVAVSWLIGRSGNMWTYVWGIYHKEYTGASFKTYGVLTVGIGIYIFGVLLLSRSFFN